MAHCARNDDEKKQLDDRTLTPVCQKQIKPQTAVDIRREISRLGMNAQISDDVY